MNADEVLAITMREIRMIGEGWRVSWAHFDGRTLRSQLDDIARWARAALDSESRLDCTEGTEFYVRQWVECGSSEEEARKYAADTLAQMR